MVLALRQYRLWLCDNYADLEHKEIRYSIMALVVGLLFNVFYLSGTTGMVAQYAVQAFDYMFVILLLWLVETLQTLDDTLTQMPGLEAEAAVSTMVSPTTLPPDIDLLLDGRVEATQLYLRHDIKIGNLCTAIGTNRSYLSLYFKRQNTTYNAYINGLRIQHFIRLYREAVAAKRTFTVQQLAEESGFRNYATFGKAFKQQMGQTATAWMRDAAE
jgi:AraC-like DNA-binding protein